MNVYFRELFLSFSCFLFDLSVLYFYRFSFCWLLTQCSPTPNARLSVNLINFNVYVWKEKLLEWMNESTCKSRTNVSMWPTQPTQHNNNPIDATRPTNPLIRKRPTNPLFMQLLTVLLSVHNGSRVIRSTKRLETKWKSGRSSRSYIVSEWPLLLCVRAREW